MSTKCMIYNQNLVLNYTTIHIHAILYYMTSKHTNLIFYVYKTVIRFILIMVHKK